jgi:hypothetical protein
VTLVHNLAPISPAENCVWPSTRRYQLGWNFSFISTESSKFRQESPSEGPAVSYSELNRMIKQNKYHSFPKRPTKWIILQCITGYDFKISFPSSLPNVLIRYSFPILLPGKKVLRSSFTTVMFARANRRRGFKDWNPCIKLSSLKYWSNLLD